MTICITQRRAIRMQRAHHFLASSHSVVRRSAAFTRMDAFAFDPAFQPFLALDRDMDPFARSIRIVEGDELRDLKLRDNRR
jgi:hypothetical protein